MILEPLPTVCSDKLFLVWPCLEEDLGFGVAKGLILDGGGGGGITGAEEVDGDGAGCDALEFVWQGCGTAVCGAAIGAAGNSAGSLGAGMTAAGGMN